MTTTTMYSCRGCGGVFVYVKYLFIMKDHPNFPEDQDPWVEKLLNCQICRKPHFFDEHAVICE